jgi:hypothetical protein
MHQILIVSSGTTFVVGLDLSWPPQVGIRFENVSFAYQSRQDKKARPDAKLYIENVHVCLPMQTVQTCSHTYPGPASGTYFFRLREMLTKKRSNCKKRALDSKIARHAKNARNVLKMSKHHLLPHKPAAHFAVDKNAL